MPKYSAPTASNPVVIVEAVRTPIGGFQGQLGRLSGPELGCMVTCGILGMVPGVRSAVEGVIMGSVLTAGVGQAPARQVVTGSGLPLSTRATTVNKVCGSGMESVAFAYNVLAMGQMKAVIAGGMESMSNAPLLVKRPPKGEPASTTTYADHLFLDGLENARDRRSMGLLAEAAADKYGFKRGDQDAYALESLARATTATEKEWFAREIVPIMITTPSGTTEVAQDEFLKRAKPEKIPHLKPAFKEKGTITAASASGLADGAAALLMTTAREAATQGWHPRARIVGIASVSREPEWFTLAPIDAIREVLKQVGWTIKDVDLFEINEAFAIVPMAAMKDLKIPHSKLNVHGGACALGHPIGASGARVIVTLLNALERLGKKKGVAAICIGGGEAIAVAIERDA